MHLVLRGDLLDRQVDGIILAPVENTETQINYLLKTKIPFVLIDRYFPEIKTNFVALDNYNAAFKAISHLIDNKVRRIGMINYQSSLFHLKERKRGYLTALKKNNIPFDKNWYKTIAYDKTKEEVEKAIDELLHLDKPIDGLFFSANLIGSYGIKYINKLSIRVPDQLAIVSFDETEAADLFYSPLTYIKQPLVEMSRLAVKVLLENMESPKINKQINTESELIIQQSSLRR